MRDSKISSGEHVFNRLKEKIRTGKYKAGEKLPTEMELAERYSVSRNTVRAAINRLSMLGMVESFQGKGTFVKDMNFTDRVEKLLPMFFSEGSDYLSIMNLRIAVESQAAFLAARRATYREIQELEQIVEDLEANRTDLKYYAENDIKIHSKIAELSGNNLFVSLIEMIREILQDVLEDFIAEFGNYESLTSHRRILESIKMADADAARTAMQKHLEIVIERYLWIQKKQDMEQETE